MSGGGGGTTTVQKADPWAGVQPYLQQLYAGASNAAQSTPQYYPGSTVAQPDQYTWDTLNQMTTMAQNGTGSGNLFKALAAQTAQGNDTVSRAMMDAANGNNIQGSALKGIVSGSDLGQQVLAQLAQGGGTAGNALTNIANGLTPEQQAEMGVVQGTDAASKYYSQLLSGSMLNGNPYLSDMVSNINADTTRDFRNSVLPGIASQLSLAGRYGSGAQDQAISDASINLADRLAANATNIYGNNYAAERQLQDAAAGKLQSGMLGAAGALSGQRSGAASALGALQTGAANARTGNITAASGALNSQLTSNLGNLSSRELAGQQGLLQGDALDRSNLQLRQQVSDYLDNLNQQNLTDQVNRWNFNQNAAWQPLMNLNSILNGSMSLNGSSTSQSGSTGRALLGGGLSGAATGAAIGSIVPGVGTALGAGIGGVGGLLMGLL